MGVEPLGWGGGGGGLYHSEVRGDEICVRVVQLYYVMLIGF